MSSTRSGFPKARATELGWHGASLLLCAHGIRGGAGIAQAHAESIAALSGFAQVTACCLNGEPDLETALAGIGGGDCYVVPLLMAEGYTNDLLSERVLAAQAVSPARFRLCRPVGSHDALADLIVASAESRCRNRGWPLAETGLLLIGHGTTRNARSSESLRRHLARIESRGVFAEVGCGFFDQEPRVAQALDSMTARRSVAVGHFADAGPHGADDVARLLAGLEDTVAYAGPVGREPGLVDLILDRVRQVDATTLAA